MKSRLKHFSDPSPPCLSTKFMDAHLDIVLDYIHKTSCLKIHLHRGCVHSMYFFRIRHTTHPFPSPRGLRMPFFSFRPAIVTIGCKVYLISKDTKNGFGNIYILTESSWKPLNYTSHFSMDMASGQFTSSSIHCSDIQNWNDKWINLNKKYIL